MTSLTPTQSLALAIGCIAYLLIVRALRFQRRDALLCRFGYGTVKPMGAMTFEDAASIHHELAEMEFPFSFLNSMEFALFRTYGIPSISSLLVSTKQLTSTDIIPKRLADTGVLMFEIEGSLPSSIRWLQAVARTNRIHDTYRRAGKISEEDMLYTLSLFAGEPLRWISRYEWREFTPMEKAAIGTFWKGVGDAMHVDYAALPSCDQGWEDGAHWLDEILLWGEAYEQTAMVPHENNHKLACASLNYILWPVPKRFVATGYCAFQSLMDDRLTKAVMLEKPPQFFYTFTQIVLACRRVILRHLALPRPEMWRTRYIDDTSNTHGRYNTKIYGGLPIYVKDDFAARWNLQAWIFWALGKPIPGDHGDAYLPQGYDLREVGPRGLVPDGNEAAQNLKDEMLPKGACPFRVKTTQ
ncbi:hypothetical protein AYL99_00945 [Fonsecaea erecta]|uniref:Uncharacterized protein n=1 Tax=Fonsecaea erecta TaxID=1367422 RepID=A0A179A0L8_9EURO|nr:hypothetical protein AYL99_00945 [Fonsecaea erecta]OAP64973.1 hypothetical protein AYL99_00945 [Fonsecaea erecta]